jgi:hypothetical protein
MQARLQRITGSAEEGSKQLCPQFDKGGFNSRSYDAVILAMPPKDIMRFFNNNGSRPDAQSQADLHRRTNHGRLTDSVLQGYRRITLLPEVLRR